MERVHRFDRRQERCDRIAPTLLASGVGAERACAWPLGRLLPTPRGRTEPTRMERDDEEWGQLATKIPKELQQRLKLHCVKTGVLIQGFVTRALREKLDRDGRRGRGRE